MADVDVYDADYVEALEASVIVGGHVNEAGMLVLERGNGEEFNAGQVVPDLDTRFPLNSVYMSFSSTDPATILGGGVWTRLKDRMLIGVGDNPRWDTPDETGGSETVTLTEAQLASHLHQAQYPNDDALVVTDGSHSVLVLSGVAREEPTSTVGSDEPHDNMPPFRAVYMWYRSA